MANDFLADQMDELAKKLLKYRISDITERERLEFLTVLNKLRRNGSPVDFGDFIKCIESSGVAHNKCVRIKRNVDSCLQVDQIKFYPHYLLCKIFRFPTANFFDLKDVSLCPFGISKREKLLCINP
ncbi:unnamed protein product [Lymnaea stagnalis]|uniref:MH1 domain-containing protein n=1 Tax=Lymnaea stagnalis TaxID=6523 RepID=A0AAV2IC26_LYMST